MKILKNSIISFLLILSVFTGFAFSQTKTAKHRPKKRTITVKKVVTVNKSAAITTPTGLTYIITQNGTGAKLKAGDNVTVNYTGLLTSGQKFDSSLDSNKPFTFPLGAGRVIKGWDEGVQKLRVGDRATFIIPANLAYGEKGAGEGIIPPNATLIFIIEVVGVQ